MAFALACRGAALVTTPASGPLMKASGAARSGAAATSASRLLSTRRRAWGVYRRSGGSPLLSCGSESRHTIKRGGGARMMMCTAASGVELSAEGVEIGASIKAKGDVVRDLKAAGVSKEDLKPHIEVCLEPPRQSCTYACNVQHRRDGF